MLGHRALHRRDVLHSRHIPSKLVGKYSQMPKNMTRFMIRFVFNRCSSAEYSLAQLSNMMIFQDKSIPNAQQTILIQHATGHCVSNKHHLQSSTKLFLVIFHASTNKWSISILMLDLSQLRGKNWKYFFHLAAISNFKLWPEMGKFLQRSSSAMMRLYEMFFAWNSPRCVGICLCSNIKMFTFLQRHLDICLI